VVILTPVADEPLCRIQHRLESIQKAHRRASEQAVVAIHPRSDKSGYAIEVAIEVGQQCANFSKLFSKTIFKILFYFLFSK